jgi:hypothetical protein
MIIVLIIILFLLFYGNKSEFILNDIAIIFHVGNISVFYEILKDYPNFFSSHYTQYISCDSEKLADIIKLKLPLANIYIFENRGMDIGPFLLTIPHLKQHSYYIKLHTKSDKKWRNSLISPLYDKLSNKLIITNEPLMYGAKSNILDVNFFLNYVPILKILERNYPEYVPKFLEYYTSDKKPRFVAGTIFMFNNSYLNLLKSIKDIKYEVSIMETGYTLNNVPRKTHAWEYLFGYLLYFNNDKILD